MPNDYVKRLLELTYKNVPEESKDLIKTRHSEICDCLGILHTEERDFEIYSCICLGTGLDKFVKIAEPALIAKGEMKIDDKQRQAYHRKIRLLTKIKV